MFNKSLADGVFPRTWKLANVSPVYKKGSKSDKVNYRPISLLSNMSKVLEKIVFKRLYEYLTENRLLIEKNSGFKKKDSTTNQLLKIVHQIYQDVNDGMDTCMVFLDVSKAFDKAILTQCYTQHALRPYIDSEIDHIRHFIKIQFVNKGIEFINLPIIFKDKSVISSIPTYFENKESPIICFKYNKPIRSTVLTITN